MRTRVIVLLSSSFSSEGSAWLSSMITFGLRIARAFMEVSTFLLRAYKMGRRFVFAIRASTHEGGWGRGALLDSVGGVDSRGRVRLKSLLEAIDRSLEHGCSFKSSFTGKTCFDLGLMGVNGFLGGLEFFAELLSEGLGRLDETGVLRVCRGVEKRLEGGFWGILVRARVNGSIKQGRADYFDSRGRSEGVFLGEGSRQFGPNLGKLGDPGFELSLGRVNGSKVDVTSEHFKGRKVGGNVNLKRIV